MRTLLADEPASRSSARRATAPPPSPRSQALPPDLVFLDVQMPGADGFDVIDAVGADKMPFVVFVTAYDRYALRAFDVHALDYLLKPFDRERFRQALDARARAARAAHRRRPRAAPRRDRQGPEAGRSALDRFVIKSGGRVFFVRADEIDWIEAAGNYVKLHVGHESHLIRETMNAVEAQARPDDRSSASTARHIVNIEQVRELQPWFNGEYVVFLKNGTRLTLSRGYREKLQDRIGRTL